MKHGHQFVLATRNQHKIKEIKQILGSDFEYQTLSDYIAIQIKEAGRTLLENSLAKAAFTYKVSQLPSLADDSGLFVDALNNEPGIFSARYGANDEQRIARVLQNLEGQNNREASFKAVFVLYFALKTYVSFEGICSGQITHEPRGTHGFGYDPIFVPEGYKKTFAELGASVKNAVSHRARALHKIREYLDS